MTDRALMQQVLEELDKGLVVAPASFTHKALRAALAEPETCKPGLQVEGPEPVAVAWKLVPANPTKEMCQAVCNCHDIDHQEQIVDDYRAMLAAAPTPPTRRPLTDEEIDKMWRDTVNRFDVATTPALIRAFTRAIERKITGGNDD